MPPAFAYSDFCQGVSVLRKETAVHEIAIQRQCMTDPAAVGYALFRAEAHGVGIAGFH